MVKIKTIKMKTKRVVASVLAVIMTVGVITAGTDAKVSAAKENEASSWVDLGEVTDAGEKLTNDFWASQKECKDWDNHLYKNGGYVGFFSRDHKKFWINGIQLKDNGKKVEIPQEIDGVTVTKIGAFSLHDSEPNVFKNFPYDEKYVDFYRGDYVENIVIPSTVTEVGEKSFANCKNLTSVDLGSGMVRLGEKVFENSNKLKKLDLPVSLKELDRLTFAGAKNLTQVTIAKGNSLFSSRKNAIYSKNGKVLYLVLGSSRYSYTLDSKVNEIVDLNNRKRMNYLGELVGNRKVAVKKNKIYGMKNQCVYLKKNGELLYCGKTNGKKTRIPSCVKKITKRTCFRVSMYELYLPKGLKQMDCLAVDVEFGNGDSYILEKIYTKGKIKFLNKSILRKRGVKVKKY